MHNESQNKLQWHTQRNNDIGIKMLQSLRAGESLRKGRTKKILLGC